ncbi:MULTISPECIES: YbgS-like family protein [Pantoea]|uniref:YbgS-like family protein n=1 Tax=Pantoea eucrina TaxID=472693 RepID=A0ABS1Z432_9GAMM|nr:MULTISPECIES: YbgS-like family protein [Pantoea]PPS58232.1 homeobox protein YbgS [Pantoea sp. BRM17]KAA6047965.1 homeobox protein YbgS [Pantoea sp. Bo_7]KAA6093210.1 homeobox protein YbgS [Pantoea sp. Bo_10]MBM0747156.1 YbgS-like family protein [Pantoea eucrina]MCL9646346.1 YbgS-like family protein [Pantoea eucrina]
MNKFAIVFLTAAMTLGSGAAMAANNNGQANASAEAGAAAGGAKQNLPPHNVDNSDINTGNTNTNGAAMSGTESGDMSAKEVHKNTMCKDGRCPDMNKKVETKSGSDNVNTKTDGTTQ